MFLGRQPILNATQTVIGYELLFRAGQQDETAKFASATTATAEVVCAAFTELGIAQALRHLKAFVNIDAGLLASDAIELLPPEQVVLEVSAALDAAALDRCRALTQRGYQFSIDIDPTDPGAAGELLKITHFIKIDIANAPREVIAAAVARLSEYTGKLLAAKVETAEQHDWCAQLGFRYFQGYYFARPLIEEGRKLDPTTHGLMRLISLVSSDVETREIEEAFKADPALTMNLLRLVNSAALGLRTPISSIAQAIVLLGHRQLLRWLHLLIFRGGGGTLANNPLMLHAAMRGRMMEMLVERCRAGDRTALESAFVVGVMSLMPAALRMPMTKLLEEISLAPAVRSAVADYEGLLGQLLLLIEYYDDGNELGCTLSMQRIGEIDQHMLNNCVVQTLLWVQGLEA